MFSSKKEILTSKETIKYSIDNDEINGMDGMEVNLSNAPESVN